MKNKKRKIRFRGWSDKHQQWFYGYCAVLHETQTDSQNNVVGVKCHPCIFNDKIGERTPSGYWNEVEPFKKIIQSRYPWISDNAIKVIINKAQMEMMRVRDEETNGREYSKTLAQKGKLDDAIEHLRLRLELNPDDAKSWYDLGELLFKKGDASGGFDAFRKGDEVLKKK